MRTFNIKSINELLKLIENDRSVIDWSGAEYDCKVFRFHDDVEIIIPGIKFAKSNKNETLREYKDQLRRFGSYSINDVALDRLIICGLTKFEQLTNNLMSTNPLWAGLGGSILKSEFKTKEFNWDLKMGAWSEKQMSYYRNHSASICCLLIADSGWNKFYAYINPEGYSYARYVGL